MSTGDIVILGSHSLTHTCLAWATHLGNFSVVVDQSTKPITIKHYTYMKFKGCLAMAIILLYVYAEEERLMATVRK